MPSVPKALIATNVIDRLKTLSNGATGVLFGQLHETTIVIIGFGVSSTGSGRSEDLILSMPCGVQICGAFTSETDVDQTKDLLSAYSKDFDCVDTPLLLTSVQKDYQSYVLLNGNASKLSCNTLNSCQLVSTFVYFRITAEISVSFDETSQGIKLALEDLKKKTLSEDVAFMLTSKTLFLAGSTSDKVLGPSGITGDHRVKDLFDTMPEHGSKDYDVVPATIYMKKTKEIEEETRQSIVPHIRQVRHPFESVRMSLKVDVLGLVHRNAKVATLFSTLSKSFSQGLRMLETNLIHQVSLGTKDRIAIPEVYHFLPAHSSHIISVVYPKNWSDAELKQQRELLHKRYGFSLDQPIFRRSQAYKFPGDGSPNGPLLNPHEGLNSGVKGGQATLVKGLYSYHHYMQDRFDDNGWGCAYRSLQTIVSWFRLQGFTEAQVPSHKQIQECLVKIGDKPSSFIGSRQWIGSTEVSFALETLLGVTCKILTASTGEEVGSLGSELSYHFQTHGTPIMIGGGVLAHTIIGVDYNRSTGDIKFLILDPHYTGGEDLSTITGKGWVGWKDIKFWTKNAFYNLCLPLRPIGDI